MYICTQCRSRQSQLTIETQETEQRHNKQQYEEGCLDASSGYCRTCNKVTFLIKESDESLSRGESNLSSDNSRAYREPDTDTDTEPKSRSELMDLEAKMVRLRNGLRQWANEPLEPSSSATTLADKCESFHSMFSQLSQLNECVISKEISGMISSSSGDLTSPTKPGNQRSASMEGHTSEKQWPHRCLNTTPCILNTLTSSSSSSKSIHKADPQVEDHNQLNATNGLQGHKSRSMPREDLSNAKRDEFQTSKRVHKPQLGKDTKCNYLDNSEPLEDDSQQTDDTEQSALERNLLNATVELESGSSQSTLREKLFQAKQDDFQTLTMPCKRVHKQPLGKAGKRNYVDKAEALEYDSQQTDVEQSALERNLLNTTTDLESGSSRSRLREELFQAKQDDFQTLTMPCKRVHKQQLGKAVKRNYMDKAEALEYDIQQTDVEQSALERNLLNDTTDLESVSSRSRLREEVLQAKRDDFQTLALPCKRVHKQQLGKSVKRNYMDKIEALEYESQQTDDTEQTALGHNLLDATTDFESGSSGSRLRKELFQAKQDDFQTLALPCKRVHKRPLGKAVERNYMDKAQTLETDSQQTDDTEQTALERNLLNAITDLESGSSRSSAREELFQAKQDDFQTLAMPCKRVHKKMEHFQVLPMHQSEYTQASKLNRNNRTAEEAYFTQHDLKQLQQCYGATNSSDQDASSEKLPRSRAYLDRSSGGASENSINSEDLQNNSYQKYSQMTREKRDIGKITDESASMYDQASLDTLRNQDELYTLERPVDECAQYTQDSRNVRDMRDSLYESYTQNVQACRDFKDKRSSRGTPLRDSSGKRSSRACQENQFNLGSGKLLQEDRTAQGMPNSHTVTRYTTQNRTVQDDHHKAARKISPSANVRWNSQDIQDSPRSYISHCIQDTERSLSYQTARDISACRYDKASETKEKRQRRNSVGAPSIQSSRKSQSKSQDRKRSRTRENQAVLVSQERQDDRQTQSSRQNQDRKSSRYTLSTRENQAGLGSHERRDNRQSRGFEERPDTRGNQYAQIMLASSNSPDRSSIRSTHVSPDSRSSRTPQRYRNFPQKPAGLDDQRSQAEREKRNSGGYQFTQNKFIFQDGSERGNSRRTEEWAENQAVLDRQDRRSSQAVQNGAVYRDFQVKQTSQVASDGRKSQIKQDSHQVTLDCQARRDDPDKRDYRERRVTEDSQSAQSIQVSTAKRNNQDAASLTSQKSQDSEVIQETQDCQLRAMDSSNTQSSQDSENFQGSETCQVSKDKRASRESSKCSKRNISICWFKDQYIPPQLVDGDLETTHSKLFSSVKALELQLDAKQQQINQLNFIRNRVDEEHQHAKDQLIAMQFQEQQAIDQYKQRKRDQDQQSVSARSSGGGRPGSTLAKQTEQSKEVLNKVVDEKFNCLLNAIKETGRFEPSAPPMAQGVEPTVKSLVESSVEPLKKSSEEPSVAPQTIGPSLLEMWLKNDYDYDYEYDSDFSYDASPRLSETSSDSAINVKWFNRSDLQLNSPNKNCQVRSAMGHIESSRKFESTDDSKTSEIPCSQVLRATFKGFALDPQSYLELLKIDYIPGVPRDNPPKAQFTTIEDEAVVPRMLGQLEPNADGAPSLKNCPIPITCPVCHNACLIGDLNMHFRCEHNNMHFERIDRNETKTFFLNPLLTQLNESQCHRIYLLKNVLCNKSGKNLGDLLPIMLMSARISVTDNPMLNTDNADIYLLWLTTLKPTNMRLIGTISIWPTKRQSMVEALFVHNSEVYDMREKSDLRSISRSPFTLALPGAFIRKITENGKPFLGVQVKFT